MCNLEGAKYYVDKLRKSVKVSGQDSKGNIFSTNLQPAGSFMVQKSEITGVSTFSRQDQGVHQISSRVCECHACLTTLYNSVTHFCRLSVAHSSLCLSCHNFLYKNYILFSTLNKHCNKIVCRFAFLSRMQGKGEMQTYWLVGEDPAHRLARIGGETIGSAGIFSSDRECLAFLILTVSTQNAECIELAQNHIEE